MLLKIFWTTHLVIVLICNIVGRQFLKLFEDPMIHVHVLVSLLKSLKTVNVNVNVRRMIVNRNDKERSILVWRNEGNKSFHYFNKLISINFLSIVVFHVVPVNGPVVSMVTIEWIMDDVLGEKNYLKNLSVSVQHNCHRFNRYILKSITLILLFYYLNVSLNWIIQTVNISKKTLSTTF